MAPILHIVRHAEGYHNISKDGHNLRDPALTTRGEEMCSALQKRFPYLDEIDLLLASPLRRTLQTASLGFSPCLERGMKVIAVPSAQETTADPCDTGNEKEVLLGWFGEDAVDMQYLKPGWYAKEGGNAPEVEALRARARKLRQWIKAGPEKHVVLVTHGIFAHYLTGDINDEGEQTSGWWYEAEFRTYNFDEPHDDESMIYETEESKERSRSNKPEEVGN